MSGKVKWMQETLLCIQEIKSNDVTKIFDAHSSQINEWFKFGEFGSKIYFYINENKRLGFSFDAPILYGYCVYFLKNTSN